MKYFDELKKSMDWLSEQPNTLFLGQAVEYPGTAMTNTLKDVDKSKLLEMPVNEVCFGCTRWPIRWQRVPWNTEGGQ